MSLEQTIDNLQIRNANMVTFVGTSNTMVDTTTGRIQTKGIQHNSNVITDVSGPHGRGVATLKKYPDIIFEKEKFEYNNSSNTYSQAGYTVSVSSQDANLTNDERGIVYYMFDGAGAGPYDNQWTSASASNYGAGTFNNTNAHYQIAATDVDGATIPHGEWIKLKMPKKIRLERVFLQPNLSNMNETPEDFKIYGSNDGTTWKLLITQTGMVPRDAGNDIVPATTISGYYNEYAMVITKIYNNAQPDTSIEELEFYGYEEDPPAGDHSVDTTFKSRFNNAQTTGVQVLVDGATGVGTNQISGGPDPSGNQSTYVTDGKYWTLNGTLTSNLAVEANTFLEGDQPHAVSVWFNSSNLEANVSNTCVFSVSDQEKLDSQNLDLQSNTWHNLTYAYQGEGGSRVTYLDGRKVAEDQAEDTFGDYPPFEMTGYSQGGYVVSASSMYGTTQHPYLAFDNNTNPDDPYRWVCADTKYNLDGSYNGSESHTDVDGNVEQGEWLKIELPHKLKVSYFEIAPYPIDGSQSWRNYAILGSNDDIKWYQVQKVSGLAAGNGVTAGSVVPTGTYKNSAFKYFVFIWGNKAADINRHVSMGELKLYGHRENDLVRLPDPTNVLKYPHIIINEPAKRGYVVSSSTESVPPNTTGSYQAYNIFDGELVFDGGNSNTPPNGTAWISLGSKYDGSGNPTGTAASTNVIDQSPVATPGEWFQLELPHKVKLSSIRVMGQTNNTTELAGRSPVDAVLAGSNNGTTWTTVLSYTGASWTTLSEFKSFPANVDSTNAYKYFRFIITKTGGDQYAAIQEFEFYGTGVDSIPIQIGGGNIDKVANFRVYDRFIEEDQVNEIWNAQKEEFERAKPQMVLQQGKLGIGTDAPQGSLSVADEPHNVEEFPPRAMTGYKTYIEGHGEFCTSESNVYTSGYESYKAFNKNSTGTSANWWTQSDAGSVPSYSTSSGDFSYFSYDSQYSINVEGATKMGHWLQIEFPYKINYRYSDIQAPHHSIGRQPRAGHILGSNDLSGMWTSLHNFTNVTRTHAYESVRYTPPTVSTQTFKYFRLVIEEMNNYQYAGIARWDIFGTREQGQSVLHDGQLTLTKNLDVPRIGPPLDADDTPRRDRLVVEYNTSSNPVFEGAVRDTSGRGNDGVFYGGASYDANEKVLEFPGSDDFIFTRVQNKLGAWKHSASFWVKYDNTSTGIVFMMTKTGNTSGQSNGSIGFSIAGGAFRYFFWGDDVDWNYSIQSGTLYHIVLTYDGGTANTSRKLYINGVDQGSPDSRTSGQSGALDLETTTSQMKIGCGINNGEDLDGSVSNFKLYDCALTASEVKTLYDMGRNGSVANPQSLHITRNLNVDGIITSNNPAFHVYRDAGDITTNDTLIVWNQVRFNRGGCYDSNTGIFHPPVDGMYHFSVFGMSDAIDNPVVSFRFEHAPPGETTFTIIGALWPYQFTRSNSGTTHGGVSGSFVYYLEAGSQFRVLFHGTELLARGNSHNGFSGFLIG